MVVVVVLTIDAVNSDGLVIMRVEQIDVMVFLVVGIRVAVC